ncbi:hypothetical protein FGB62_12g243 [Gracilaria domingensis]|nr:hypothetical protein FGB62_12g243 [Gracilaria domingensis]
MDEHVVDARDDGGIVWRLHVVDVEEDGVGGRHLGRAARVQLIGGEGGERLAARRGRVQRLMRGADHGGDGAAARGRASCQGKVRERSHGSKMQREEDARGEEARGGRSTGGGGGGEGLGKPGTITSRGAKERGWMEGALSRADSALENGQKKASAERKARQGQQTGSARSGGGGRKQSRARRSHTRPRRGAGAGAGAGSAEQS